MAYGNALANKSSQEIETERRKQNLRTVKGYLKGSAVKARFEAILGKRAPQFCASLVNVVSGSPKLLDCVPDSIMAAAYVAATYDLPIDSNLGFSAIVPYKGKAQFQMMYKGFIQLAIRTGEYEKMGCSEVYEDEMVSYNPITCECQFVDDFSQCKQRQSGDVKKIVGYYAWFRLKQGYRAELYMSKSEMEAHAKTYSKAYSYDVRNNKRSSVWSSNFTAMAKKTVIKQLLSKWGILSVEVQRAIQDDQKVYEASGQGVYEDNQDEPLAAEDPFLAASMAAEDVEYWEVDEPGEPDEGPAAQEGPSQESEEPEELDIENP